MPVWPSTVHRPPSTNDHPILLFDGVCNLCNSSVQWVIERDSAAKFRFASLQSETGQRILQEHHLPTGELNTVVLVDSGKVYTCSDVPLRIFGNLGGLWPMLKVLFIVPRPLRNAVYDWIARNRYKWFGKKEACWLPTPALKTRFL